jgi:hypothetical protein
MKKEYNFNLNGTEINITQENTEKKYFSKAVNYFSNFFKKDIIYYFVDREDYVNPENSKEDILAVEDTDGSINGMTISRLEKYLNTSLLKSENYIGKEKVKYVEHLFPNKEIIYVNTEFLINKQNAVKEKRVERRVETRIECKKTILTQLLEDISTVVSENTNVEKVDQFISVLKEGNEYEITPGIFYFIKDDLIFVRKNDKEPRFISPLSIVSVIKSKVFTKE